MKITDGCAVWLQACDVWAMLCGDVAEFAGLVPDELISELTANCLPRNGIGWTIDVPDDAEANYRFRYRFSNPVAVWWINQQPWLLEFEPLIKRERYLLEREAHHLESDARGASTMMIMHAHDFTDGEINKMRAVTEQMRYKAAALRVVLGYLRGQVPIRLPDFA